MLSHTFLSSSLPLPAPSTMPFAHCYAMTHRPEHIICSHADHSAGTISPYRACQGWKAPRSVTWNRVGQCDILRWLGERALMARELLENLRRLRLLIALAVGDGSYGSGRDAAAGFVALSVRFWAIRRQVSGMARAAFVWTAYFWDFVTELYQTRSSIPWTACSALGHFRVLHVILDFQTSASKWPSLALSVPWQDEGGFTNSDSFTVRICVTTISSLLA